MRRPGGILLLAAVLLSVVPAALIIGAWSWARSSSKATERLLAGAAMSPRTFSTDSLGGLPAPVQRYFRHALRDGQPFIQSAELQHEGSFQMGTDERGWRTFRSRQSFVSQPPGFVWNAAIAYAPMTHVYVRDALIGGAGSIDAKLLGVFTVARQRDNRNLDAGALQRWLAEAIWFPTALLPDNGVTWTAIDDRRARASVTVVGTVVSLEFRFNDDGDVSEVFAPDRAREVSGAYVPTPWIVRCTQFGEWQGVRVPIECSVSWQLPDRELAYWRGRVTSVRYDTAQASAH